jgi:hypothetical protein
MIYKNVFYVSQEANYVSTTHIHRLMHSGETLSVYCEKHSKHTNTLCGQTAVFWYVKAGVTYSNLWALKRRSATALAATELLTMRRRVQSQVNSCELQ